MFPVRPTAGLKWAGVLLYLTDLVNKLAQLTRWYNSLFQRIGASSSSGSVLSVFWMVVGHVGALSL